MIKHNSTPIYSNSVRCEHQLVKAAKNSKSHHQLKKSKHFDLTNKWDTQLEEKDYEEISELSNSLTNYFSSMHMDGFELDLKDIDVTSQLEEIKRTNKLPDRQYTRKLIRVLGKQKNEADAEFLWNLMDKESIQKDIWDYTSLLSVYCECNDIDKMEQLMGRIEQNGLMCDHYCYSLLIKAYCNKGDIDHSCQILYDMWLKKDIQPDNVTFSILIKGCMQQRQYNRLWELYNLMKTYIGQPDVVTTSLMIQICGYTNKFEEAMNLFEGVDRTKDMTQGLYHNMMNAVAKSKKYELNTFNYFHRMKNDHFVPTLQSYNILLKACSTSGDLSRLNQVLDMIYADDMTPDNYSYMYIFKCLSQCSSHGLPFPAHPVGYRRYSPKELMNEDIYKQNQKERLTIEDINQQLYLDHGGYVDEDTNIIEEEMNIPTRKDLHPSRGRSHEPKEANEIEIDRDNTLGEDIGITDEEKNYVKEMIKNMILMNRKVIEENGGIENVNITDLLNQNKQNQTDLPEEEEWINEDWTKEFEEEYKKSTALFDQLNAQQQNDTNQNTSSPNETIEVRGKGRRIRRINLDSISDTKNNKLWETAVNCVLDNDVQLLSESMKSKQERKHADYEKTINDIQQELTFMKNGHEPSTYELVKAISQIPIPKGELKSSTTSDTVTERSEDHQLSIVKDCYLDRPYQNKLLTVPYNLQSLAQWNALYIEGKYTLPDIQKYTKKEADRLWNQLINSGITPSKQTINAYIQVYAESLSLRTAVDKLELLKQYNYEPDEITYHNIIRMFIRSKRYNEAAKYTQEMQEKYHYTPRPETFGEIIDGYAKQNNLEQCLLLLTYIKEKHLKYPHEYYLKRTRQLCAKKGLQDHPSLPPDPMKFVQEFKKVQKVHGRVHNKTVNFAVNK